MACGCKERGDAILRGVKSIAKGDLGQTKTELKSIAMGEPGRDHN